MEASVSIVENTGGAATSLGVPAEEDRVSVVGVGDREVIYQINGKQVRKEEWTRFHKNQDNHRKQRQERAEEKMNNGHDLEDHKEGLGDNHHNDGEPPHEDIVSTL